MIFVTVGTHEQPFNRLIKKIDELKQDGTIYCEEVNADGKTRHGGKSACPHDRSDRV